MFKFVEAQSVEL